MSKEATALPLLDPDAAQPAVREALASEPPLKILRAVANAESAFVPWLNYANTLIGGLTLPPRLRELTMLQVARLTPHSEYEWVQHVGLARRRGITEEQLAAIEAGDSGAPCFDEADRELLAFVTALTRDGIAPEAAARSLAERLSLGELVEVILLVAHMLMLARVSATFGLTPDAPAADQILRRSDAVSTSQKKE